MRERERERERDHKKEGQGKSIIEQERDIFCVNQYNDYNRGFAVVFRSFTSDRTIKKQLAGTMGARSLLLGGVCLLVFWHIAESRKMLSKLITP